VFQRRRRGKTVAHGETVGKTLEKYEPRMGRKSDHTNSEGFTLPLRPELGFVSPWNPRLVAVGYSLSPLRG
jgi:hypothetical protein